MSPCEVEVITLMACAQVGGSNLTHAGTAYVSNIAWNTMCDLCRRENAKDWGLCRMHVKVIPSVWYSSCITSARISLENAKQWWVMPLNPSQHGYWGLLGVESWYHEICWWWNRSISLLASICLCRKEWAPAGVLCCALPAWDTGSLTPMQALPFTLGPTGSQGPVVPAFPAVLCAAAWSQKRKKKAAGRVMPTQVCINWRFTLGEGETGSRLVYWHI